MRTCFRTALTIRKLDMVLYTVKKLIPPVVAKEGIVTNLEAKKNTIEKKSIVVTSGGKNVTLDLLSKRNFWLQ